MQEAGRDTTGFWGGEGLRDPPGLREGAKYSSGDWHLHGALESELKCPADVNVLP